MPMYEYHCAKCGQVFEELASVDADASPACPECNSTETKRCMSAPSVKTSEGLGNMMAPPSGGCGQGGFS